MCVAMMHGLRVKSKSDLLLPCSDLQRLGAPADMLVMGEHLCLGCSGGSILCIPRASLQRGTAEGALELRDAGGMGRLLTSFFARWGPRMTFLMIKLITFGVPFCVRERCAAPAGSNNGMSHALHRLHLDGVWRLSCLCAC
jgi:hypothetical protein